MERSDFWLRLADEPLHLAPAYPNMARYCRDYVITPTPEDMARYEKVWGPEPLTTNQEERLAMNTSGETHSEGYLELLALYQKIAQGFLSQDILLFHGSTLAIDGKAYIFTAPSGTGKSTHRSLWQQRFGDRLTVVNDDKPLLRFGADGIWAYGTPYGGKERLYTNTKAPLAGIVILHQAPENTIAPLTAREAYPRLLCQAFRPNDPEGMIHAMNLTEKLIRLPIFSLGCTISQEAVELAYTALTGGNPKEETL